MIINKTGEKKILYYKKIITPTKLEKENHTQYLKTNLKKNKKDLKKKRKNKKNLKKKQAKDKAKKLKVSRLN